MYVVESRALLCPMPGAIIRTSLLLVFNSHAFFFLKKPNSSEIYYVISSIYIFLLILLDPIVINMLFHLIYSRTSNEGKLQHKCQVI